MKKKLGRIGLLVLLFLIGISFYAYRTPAPTVAVEENSPIKSKIVKRTPASIAPHSPGEKPVLGTGFFRVDKKYPRFPEGKVVQAALPTSNVEETFLEVQDEPKTEPVIDSGPIDEYGPITAIVPAIPNRLPEIPDAIPQEVTSNNSSPSNFTSGGIPFAPIFPTSQETPAEVAETEDGSSNQSETSTSAQFTVSYIGIINGELVIRGTNLTGVTSLNVNGTSVDVDFTSISKTATEIIAQALSGVTLMAGTVYNLVISDAFGQATFPIDIVLEDGSVSSTKLAQGSALDGYILVYDAVAGRWVESAPLWLSNANGVHYASGNVGIGNVLPDYALHVNTPGSALTFGPHYYSVIQRSEGGTANDGGLSFGYFADGANMTGALISSTNDQNLFIGTTDFQQTMTIENASGFIGIGIGATDPSYQLDVRNQFGESSIRSRGSVQGNIIIEESDLGVLTRISQNETKGSIGTASDGGSTDFSIQTNGQDRIFIERLGEVGVATAAPGAAFQVGENGDGTVAVANAWNLFSDERLKKNFKKIDDPLMKMMSLNGYYYQWKNHKDQSQKIGLKAQEVQKIFPEVVIEDENGILSVSYNHLIAPLISAVKELAERDDKRIRALEEENARLRKQNEELDRRLSRLENSRTIAGEKSIR